MYKSENITFALIVYVSNSSSPVAQMPQDCGRLVSLQKAPWKFRQQQVVELYAPMQSGQSSYYDGEVKM